MIHTKNYPENPVKLVYSRARRVTTFFGIKCLAL